MLHCSLHSIHSCSHYGGGGYVTNARCGGGGGAGGGGGGGGGVGVGGGSADVRGGGVANQ